MTEKLIEYDAARYLKTQEDVDGYLKAAFDAGDTQLFIHALSDAARAKGMNKKLE
jgi:probable addiction module antidote protein